MAINKEYTTEAKVETYLNKTITTGQADDAINSAVDIIDQTTGRNFIADETASARLFDGDGERNLDIDDCIEIETVEQGNDAYGDSRSTISAGGVDGYYLLPNNYEEESLPIRQIHLRSRLWLSGFQAHQITAKWGFSEAAPPAIEFAATVLAAGIYNTHRGGGSGNVKSEKIGNYAVTYDTDKEWGEYQQALIGLEQYRRWRM